jgi:hypothetical protein
MVDRQPLASWNAGAVKSAILDFVARATKPGGAEFALASRAHSGLRQRWHALL